MAHVDLRAVWRDTFELPPALQPYWQWIVVAIVAVIVVAAFEFPVELLAALAIAAVIALMLRFTSCYLRARAALH
jgi:hypothetical protein